MGEGRWLEVAVVMGRGHRFTAKIMARGQITIPVEVRRAHGWHEGDLLEVVEDDNGSVYLRVTKESVPDYRQFIGSLVKPEEEIDVEQRIEDLRGPIDVGGETV